MQKDKFWEDLKSGMFASMVRETSKGQILSNSREVYHVLKPLSAGHDDVEAVYGIFLNAKNHLLAIDSFFWKFSPALWLHPWEGGKARY